MSTASSAATEEVALLRSFVDILKSDKRHSIPYDTLFGAITHFISTSPLADLPSFISALRESPSIWSTNETSKGAHDAIRHAVSAKVHNINTSLAKAYFADYRFGRQARQWLEGVGRPVVSSSSGAGRSTILSALLEGLEDHPNVEWGRMKDRMEEELVVEASTYNVNSADGPVALYDAVRLVSEEKLVVLDADTILPDIVGRHLDLMIRQDSADEAAKCAASLARLIRTVDKEDFTVRRHTWPVMRSLCEEASIMLRREEILDITTAFVSYLTVASSVVDILINTEPPSLPSSSRHHLHPSTDIAHSILFALYDFAGHTKPPSQEPNAYLRVWYGCLDVIEARGGAGCIDSFLRRLVSRSSNPTTEQSAFVLSTGEQTIGCISVSTLQGILLPLCQRCVQDPAGKNSFEAVHALLLAIIKAAEKSVDSATPQPDFMGEILPWYSQLLLQQHRDGHVTSEQLRSAYSVVVSAASKQSSQTHTRCVDLLIREMEQDNEPTVAQALRQTRIAITPHITFDNLSAYLDDLAWCILDTKSLTSERDEVVEAAFRMVIEGLPDESRRIGMDWWLEWKPRFKFEQTVNNVRSKL